MKVKCPKNLRFLDNFINLKFTLALATDLNFDN